MRRLIVEISGKDFSKLDSESSLQKIRSAEVLHFLKFDHQEVTMILRVEFNEPNVSIEEIFHDDLAEVQTSRARKRERERDLHLFYQGQSSTRHARRA